MDMCGIAGMIALQTGARTLRDMLDTMARRGPDAEGVFREEDAVLLHSRLSVIDPAGGAQPMSLTWEGKRYVLVYNGELYNTQELRHDLTRLGHTFRTRSDTEVILHAYARFGDNCVHKFNGIFAFAVWEPERKRLFLARDRIGVKPLFYKLHQKGILFASEIKTILRYPGVRPVLDREGVSQLILLGPGRQPGSGVLAGMEEVRPGFCGFWQEGKLELNQYWKLRDREHRETFDETLECVRYLVTDAIRRQMVADVPVGTFLSGGLDSSIITAVCAGSMKERGEVLPTFSVDYAGNDRNFRPGKFQPDSDDAYIRLMAESFGTDHHRTVLTARDLVDALEPATQARDLPGLADVDFSLFAFCREIRDHVTVALSGECADEIFGGYPWYRDPEVRSREGFPWAQNTARRAGLLPEDMRAGAEEYVMDAWLDTCRSSDVLPGTPDGERRMKEMVNLNFNWFMQTLLDRKDRMSMYHALEVRVPFCDYRIAEYLYGVPWEYKDWQGREKGLLRRAVEDLLPGQILWRKKSPYPKTFDPEYEMLVRRRLEALFLRDSPLWEMICKDSLRNLLEAPGKWPWYGQLMGTPQTMAYFLQLDHWLRAYGVDIQI